jgi:hypothetical protein
LSFPFGFQELSPGDLKRFRGLYENSVKAQPVDKLAQWFIQTYDAVGTGEFTEALSRLDVVLDQSPDYSGFVASKHVLSQVDAGSAVSYQVAMRLLAHRSPLLFRYGICLVTSGEVPVDREIANAIDRLSNVDQETMMFAQVAKLAIQRGLTPNV